MGDEKEKNKGPDREMTELEGTLIKENEALKKENEKLRKKIENREPYIKSLKTQIENLKKATPPGRVQSIDHK